MRDGVLTTERESDSKNDVTRKKKTNMRETVTISKKEK